MSTPAVAMKKYYAAMTILLLIVVGVVVLAFWANADDRADKLTTDQLNSVNEAVKEYVRNHQALPASVQEAGFKGKSDRVTYGRLADHLYMLCATHSQERDGAANPDVRQPDGTDKLLIDSLKQKHPETTYVYYDGYYYAASYRHGRGELCAVVADKSLRKKSGVEIFNNLLNPRTQ